MTRNIYLPTLGLAAITFGTAFVLPNQHVANTAAAKPKLKATYSDNVATIINRSCVSCHHDGAVAPFSLVGYDNAKKWASSIAAVTQSGAMPPWKAVHGYGEFLDDQHLSDEDVALLGEWYEDGAPRGNKDKEPKPPTFASEWILGQPDLILQPDRAYHLAAEGDDVYRNFVLKNTFDHPVWVKAIDVKPGNPKVVHHEITFLDSMGAAKKLEAANTDGELGYTSSGGGPGFMPTGTLGGWAPGVTTRMLPEGMAWLVQPKSQLVMQVHYHKDGKPEEDLTRVGLYFAKEPITKEVHLNWVFNFGIHIPAGEKSYEASATRNIDQDVTLYSAMPHMHLLGRTMKAAIILPDGKEKPLIWINDWDFNWQLVYALKEPMHIPKGSKIRVTATYDNSTGNPRNPNNPPKDVTWGEQTTDEMFLLVLGYTVDGETASAN